MICQPVSPESLDALRKLRAAVFERGEECLGLVLAGVELYASLGREVELLETMREFAEKMRIPVENTPTAGDLERLFRKPDLRSDDPDARKA